MKINWKLRFKNKVTLTAIVLAIITFVYQIIDIAGVIPSISQEQAIEVVGLIINVLVLIGIVVDPTTTGMSDSSNALDYEEPKGE